MRKSTSKCRVLFVAFLEQDNLGVGYMASVLMHNNIDVRIIDFRAGKEQILSQIRSYEPSLIGFSIIFQYHVNEFKDLINYLRKNKINSHFCAGGHYPSLRYENLLEMIPALDSIVLFEGEYTFLELTQKICTTSNWKQIKGIAYRENDIYIANPLRPLEALIDNFPAPVRQPLREYMPGKKYVTILAGRGCYYDCSFCSIREFYSKPKGPVKRIRSPEQVTREMELLYLKKNCEVFMFQDDDFPVFSQKGKKWAIRFCELLEEKKLNNKILWKINCRPDEVDEELFIIMKRSGLFLVYLGIENGTDDGLKYMNKQIKADANIRAVETLKKINMMYDFGFMLFHPESTFYSVIENINFLKKICEDGSAPITFSKMRPYASTKIECDLRKQGRLKGSPGFEDYDFHDPALNDFYAFMYICFEDWIARRDGLLNTCRWIRHNLFVCNKYYCITDVLANLDKATKTIIAESNNCFIDNTRIIMDIFQSQSGANIDSIRLNQIKADIASKHKCYKEALDGIMIAINKMSL